MINQRVPHPLLYSKVELASVVEALQINRLCLENNDFSCMHYAVIRSSYMDMSSFN